MRAAIPVSVVAILFSVACAGEDAVLPVEISLGAGGTTPSSTSVASGAALRFTNHDTIDHQIASTTCTELGSPTLAAGKSFTATLGVGPKTCTYKDGLHPTEAAFEGTVLVAAPAGGGGGGGGGY